MDPVHTASASNGHRSASHAAARAAQRVLVAATLLAACALSHAQVERTRVPIGASGCGFLARADLANGYRLDAWSGACVDGLADGRGTLQGQWKAGAAEAEPYLFEGRLRRGLRQGFGRTVSGSSEYAGTYRNGEAEGWGRARQADGSTFEGQYFDGKRHGIGVEVAADGRVTQGRWTEGRASGAFVRSDRTAQVFIDERPDGTASAVIEAGGETAAGKRRLIANQWQREGPGVYRFLRGSLYLGNFANNLPNGPGVLVMPDGEGASQAILHAGEFQNGCLRTGNTAINVIVRAADCNGR